VHPDPKGIFVRFSSRTRGYRNPDPDLYFVLDFAKMMKIENCIIFKQEYESKIRLSLNTVKIVVMDEDKIFKVWNFLKVRSVSKTL
jgi:hypothetical protein